MEYKDLGIGLVVSAQGNATPLGSSPLSERVVSAMANAAGHHVDMEQLRRSSGTLLAKAAGSEDACPTSGAAAGIVMAVAACIAGDDITRVERLPDSTGLRNEVVLQKGHAISCGASISQMIALGGGRTIEVGAVNQTLPRHVTGAINERTAALVYVSSTNHAVHHGGVPLETLIEIGRERGVPVIVDAAGEEDLRHWVATGADLVVFSGPKMVGAPTTGFICGRADLIGACRAQYAGIARPMKVGKENLMGLLAAVDEYISIDLEERAEEQLQRMSALLPRLRRLPGIAARLVRDEYGRKLCRIALTVDPSDAGRTATTLTEEMKAGDPPVYLGDFRIHLGELDIDPSSLAPSEEEIVLRGLERILLPTADRRAESR
ncbi:aminotransferase class V-fold PLP-dependent enzyme [Streptomyces sp. NPDC017520]|uniref:aminotransferase class V-fold PLP-dependent enzyme n=1 Tax=Streptomyces sp. NPDC017520 TaxID=3364998 RepID=UPI003799A470